MSFNIWQGGEMGGQPLAQTARAIRAARADVVGLQETLGREIDHVRPDRGQELAKLLGWQYLDQGGGRGILTRHDFVNTTPGQLGARLRREDGSELLVFNAHLNHAPYQPYQLLGIPYANAPFIDTAEQAIAGAQEARGGQVKALVKEINAQRERFPYLPVVLTGDFNEPSHLDWTAEAARAGVCPMPVDYPTTKAITKTGLVDTYRTRHPDPVKRPGLTWTPLTRQDDPADRHDRIDFVFAHVPGLSPHEAIISAEVVGESEQAADIVVATWPSDHRAVVATIRFPDP
jgi:exodeoxyribonuclease III